MFGARAFVAGVVFSIVVAFAPAFGQDYPSKPIKLIVPTAPAGIGDIIARQMQQKLGESGVTLVVENRPGAAGVIGTNEVAKAPADGYTFLVGNHAVLSMLPHLQKIPYEPFKSFEPVILLVTVPNILVIHPSVPANSVKELVALGKSKPGTLHFAHAGIGSFTHTASMLFAMMAGIDVVMVPFKGGGPAMIDVIGGHTQLLMNSYLASLPHVRSGKLRALGVSDTRRSDLLPGVPTIDESGVPGYQAANWWGIAVPAGTPPPIVERLNKEINAILTSDEVKKQFDAQGAVPVPMSVAEFAKFYDTEKEKWGKVVKAAGIKPN